MMKMCRLSHLLNGFLLVFITTSIVSAQDSITEYHQIYFDTDKSTLTADSRAELSALSMHLDTLKDARMTVTGHTDSRANTGYNDKLSERRIQSVLDYLKNQPGTLPPLLSSFAAGEHHPAEDNATSAGMARNRRVEIMITYPNPDKTAQTSGNIRELFDKLRPEPQEFCIDNTRDTLLKCSKGTLIQIPSFAFRRDSVQACTRIQVTEALTIGDMLEQNLSTSSNRQLIITGGMVEINAIDATGNLLNLIDNRKITLFFPADSTNADFSTFYGTRSNSDQLPVNWRNTHGKSEPESAMEMTLSYWTDCYTPPVPEDCERCRFFNCRIQRFDETLLGMRNDSQKSENKKFRSCQKALRKRKYQPLVATQDSVCVTITQYFLKRGVVPDSVLFYQLYGDYMKNRGWKTIAEATLNMQKEYDSINRIRMEAYAKIQKQQDSLNQIRMVTQKLSYNVLQSSKLGLINCDRFLNSKKTLVSVETNLPFDARIDGKLILKDYESIMPVYENGGICHFPNIPQKEKAWALFLKQENGESFYYLQKVVAGEDKINVVFTKATPEEIRMIMHKLL